MSNQSDRTSTKPAKNGQIGNPTGCQMDRLSLKLVAE